MSDAVLSANPSWRTAAHGQLAAGLLRFGGLLLLLCGVVLGQVELLPGPTIPPFPDPIGRAGMAAAVLKDRSGASVLIAVGGANFPERMPWEGGTKVFHRDGFALESLGAEGGGLWRRCVELPEACAYAAFGASPEEIGRAHV